MIKKAQKGVKQMLSKFAEIAIKQANKENVENIVYYILEDEQYGIQISKKSTNENSEENELVMHNIVKSKKEAENILDNLIKNNNDLTQASYIIEDFLKNQNNIENQTLIS